MRISNLQTEVNNLNKVIESMQKRLGLTYLDDLSDLEKEDEVRRITIDNIHHHFPFHFHKKSNINIGTLSNNSKHAKFHYTNTRTRTLNHTQLWSSNKHFWGAKFKILIWINSNNTLDAAWYCRCCFCCNLAPQFDLGISSNMKNNPPYMYIYIHIIYMEGIVHVAACLRLFFMDVHIFKYEIIKNVSYSRLAIQRKPDVVDLGALVIVIIWIIKRKMKYDVPFLGTFSGDLVRVVPVLILAQEFWIWVLVAWSFN